MAKRYFTYLVTLNKAMAEAINKHFHYRAYLGAGDELEKGIGAYREGDEVAVTIFDKWVRGTHTDLWMPFAMPKDAHTVWRDILGKDQEREVAKVNGMDFYSRWKTKDEFDIHLHAIPEDSTVRVVDGAGYTWGRVKMTERKVLLNTFITKWKNKYGGAWSFDRAVLAGLKASAWMRSASPTPEPVSTSDTNWETILG